MLQIGLVLCGIVFELAGYSALLMFRSIADGAFLHPGAWKQSLRWAMPLFITSVGVAISFRCGYFNIGAQGQLYMGAIGATFAAVAKNRLSWRTSSVVRFLTGRWSLRASPVATSGRSRRHSVVAVASVSGRITRTPSSSPPFAIIA